MPVAKQWNCGSSFGISIPLQPATFRISSSFRKAPTLVGNKKYTNRSSQASRVTSSGSDASCAWNFSSNPLSLEVSGRSMKHALKRWRFCALQTCLCGQRRDWPWTKHRSRHSSAAAKISVVSLSVIRAINVAPNRQLMTSTTSHCKAKLAARRNSILPPE
jgi:hypothetical protein